MDEEIAQLQQEVHEATAPMPMAISLPEDDEVPMMNPDEAPRSQLDFAGWVQANHRRIFKRVVYPTGDKPIKAPKVNGLQVYAVEAFGGQYYAAWTAYDGRLVGWLWYSPCLSRMDHEFAVGVVENVAVFGDMHDFTIRRKPVRVWVLALKDAASRLGAV